MPQILLIGATGHIGGAILHATLEHHPNARLTALVRDEDKASRLKAKYPQVQPIIGDLDNTELLEKASREFSIVINAAPDITHGPGVSAILEGLKAQSSEPKPKSKPFYIHTSGAAKVWDQPTGLDDAKVWDDVADAAEITALTGEEHGLGERVAIEKTVQGAAENINVAMICPGCVSGLSPSIEHPVPITMGPMVTTARTLDAAFCIGEGENKQAWIRVEDIARMYLALVHDAIATLSGSKTRAEAEEEEVQIWGPGAYYFATGEDVVFKDFMKGLGAVLHQHGVVGSAAIKSVSVGEAARATLPQEGEADPLAETWATHIAVMYGISMKLHASRMTRLGWKPEMGPVVDTFPDVVAEFLRRESHH